MNKAHRGCYNGHLEKKTSYDDDDEEEEEEEEEDDDDDDDDDDIWLMAWKTLVLHVQLTETRHH